MAEKKKKYLDLKGQVWSTPYGIGVKVFIPDEILDRCNIYREQFRKQRQTVPNKKAAEIKDLRKGLLEPVAK